MTVNLNQILTKRTYDNHLMAICDLDGVLADNRHRLPYLPPKDLLPAKQAIYWIKYNQYAIDDPLHKHVYNMYCWLAGRYSTVRRIVFTGRTENERYATMQWLNKHKLDFDELYCRPVGDHRPNYLVKLDMLNNLRMQGLRSVFCFEDDAQTVAMLREQKVYTYNWLYGQLLNQG